MASGPSSQCSRAPAGAPPAADDAHLSPQPSLNSESVAMPATERVTRNKSHGRTSESDAVPVFAGREQRAANHALQQPRATEATARRSQQQPVVGAAKPRALQQPRAAKANKARTMKKRPAPYKSLRMSAPFPTFSDDESVGNNTSNEGEIIPVGAPAPPVSSRNEGEIRHDVPRHESLRMNASTRFEGRRSARQAKQPRRGI